MTAPTHTAENDPNLRRNRQIARQTGGKVLDLRDDAKWHDVTDGNAGKGDSRRGTDISHEEYCRRWKKAFGCGDGSK